MDKIEACGIYGFILGLQAVAVFVLVIYIRSVLWVHRRGPIVVDTNSSQTGDFLSPRCTGHCCVDIQIPLSPSDLSRSCEAQKRGDTEYISDDGSRKGIVQDCHILNYILCCPSKLPDGVTWQYQCSKLLENGDCGIYEARPEMCRDYPYGHTCKIPGCTNNCRGETWGEEKCGRSEIFSEQWRRRQEWIKMLPGRTEPSREPN